MQASLFDLEWPPRSGRTITFPEIDRTAWFTATRASEKINPAQIPFVDRLAALTRASPDI